MPCYTVQTTSVEFQAENADLLLEALGELKWKYRQYGMQIHLFGGSMILDLPNQKAQLTGDADVLQDKLNKLKVQYSVQAVKRKCQKHHWICKWSDATTTTLLKRRG